MGANSSAQSLIELLKDVASTRALRRLALVSVYGTNTLWGRFGFRERTKQAMVDKLSTYGRRACYMTMDL